MNASLGFGDKRNEPICQGFFFRATIRCLVRGAVMLSVVVSYLLLSLLSYSSLK